MLEKWLIAVDLDGTLFHTDHQISARTINTLHTMAEQGHSVVIVTGRSAHSSVPRLLSIPTGTRLICSNGAYEYDLDKQTIVWASILAASKSVNIRLQILDRLPTASFGWETANGLTYEQGFIDEAGGAHTLEHGGTFEPIGQRDLFKLFVRTPKHKGGELACLIEELFDSKIEVSSSGVPFVEITALGTNKGSALARVASELGFKSNRTIAFGDNFNDVPMLRWAGESVAMGNAISEVKSIANSHAHSNAEDGVAQFLENKFALGQ